MILKSFKIAFNVFAFTLNVVFSLLMIVSAYSDRVSPEENLFLSYMGLFFPFFVFLSIFFFVYWIFLMRWKYLLIGLLTFLVCWNPVNLYFPLHLKTETTEIPTENTIKVLTYNVMGFAYKNHTKESPNSIIEYIIKSDADIVCLQEYFENNSGAHLSASRIRKAFGMYPFRSIFFLAKGGNSGLGIAVFSKYPISGSRKIQYNSRDNGSSIHTITIKEKNITLINNHLESFKLTMEDKSNYSDFIENPRTNSFGDIRGTFQQKLGQAFRLRAKQAEIIRKEIDNAKGDYVLVCGDFNDTPVSYAHRTIQGDLKDAFAESGSGFGITYNQNYFWFRIDRILHSANITPFNCTVDKVRYSDHYPIWTYLQLN